MFAPPPVQLSRAEVEARLEAKRRSAEAAGSLTRTATAGSDRSNSLHRHDSRSPSVSSKHHVFGKGGKLKVLSSISPTSPKSPPPPKKSSIFKFFAGEEVDDSPEIPNGFGEHPRQAPEPPRRGTRPPSDFFERRGPGKSFPPQSPPPQIPHPQDSPPPIPAKSRKRQLLHVRYDVLPQHLRTPSCTSPVSDTVAASQLSATSAIRPAQSRSLSVPTATDAEKTTSMTRPDHKRTTSDRPQESTMPGLGLRPASESQAAGKKPGQKDGRIEKPVAKRSDAADPIRKTLQEYDGMKLSGHGEPVERRATDSDFEMTRQKMSVETQPTWKHRKKEEIVGQLLDTASSPAKGTVSSGEQMNVELSLPPPFNLLSKDLPATPTSILATPTEMYHVIPPRPTRSVVRKARNKKSPLTPISTTHAKTNSIVRTKEDTSPSRLSAIPELSTLSSENSPVSSGLSTPTETQIHLRNGSVVTVSPPEITAWKRSYYIQGPIKLPKPVIVPRKNSMASLEAFQEAIDQVYQEALNIPRRRSDDAVVDDVCEFFDDFGFDEVSYQGDILAVDEIVLDEVTADPEQGSECFSTTPPAEDPSPVEKVLAQEIIHTLARPSPVPKPPIPPVENEETLRAKGIARLSHGMASHHHVPTSSKGRKDSLTVSNGEPAVLPLLPLPEESMLEAVLEPSRPENDVPIADPSVDQSGFDWDDDVEELDGHSHWLAPGLFPRRRRGSKGHHRRVPSTTPMQRMKELAFL